MSIILLLVTSLTILLIPLTDVFSGNTQKVCSYIVGAVFWLSLILGQIIFWIANRERISIEHNLQKKEIKRLSANYPGVLCFFQNREAAVADVTVIISFLLVIAELIFKIKSEWIILSSVSTLIFSFGMHCILNGINYKYIRYVGKLQKENGSNE